MEGLDESAVNRKCLDAEVVAVDEAIEVRKESECLSGSKFVMKVDKRQRTVSIRHMSQVVSRNIRGPSSAQCRRHRS